MLTRKRKHTRQTQTTAKTPIATAPKRALLGAVVAKNAVTECGHKSARSRNGGCSDKQESRPVSFGRLAPAKLTEVYESYWRFAAERQKVFFQRVRSEPGPWTDDPVIRSFKFTNAYRASDRVSQYLIRHVIYRNDLPLSEAEQIFRILLFKFFNKVETWQLLEHAFGAVTYADFRFAYCAKLLSKAMASGTRIYSAAYIMPPGGTAFGHHSKHENHLELLELMMRQELPQKLADARTMQQGFELLRAYPTIGDFLAYQFITDINYSSITNFSEMEFVVAGPGALDGISKCFSSTGGLSDVEIIRVVADIQEREFERLGIQFPTLWGRRLQLIDCQNLFCEVSKYARVAHPSVAGLSGRTRIKQAFRAQNSPIVFWYPPKWGINENVEASYQAQGDSGHGSGASFL